MEMAGCRETLRTSHPFIGGAVRLHRAYAADVCSRDDHSGGGGELVTLHHHRTHASAYWLVEEASALTVRRNGRSSTDQTNRRRWSNRGDGANRKLASQSAGHPKKENDVHVVHQSISKLLACLKPSRPALRETPSFCLETKRETNKREKERNMWKTYYRGKCW